MALLATAAYVNLGNILSMGNKGLSDTHSSPQVGLGTLSIQVDGFGYHRIFRYVRFMVAGTPGLVFKRAALVTGTADTSPNTTLQLSDAANFTAGNEAGKICQINVAGAAAPEGETAIIGSNTANTLSFDSRYPLSATVDVGDTYSDFGVAHYIAGTTDSLAIHCSGIIMGSPAIGDYGWAQVHGYHPAVAVDTGGAAVVAGDAGSHGATSFIIVKATATSQIQQTILGYFPQATSTTAVQAGFVIDVFNQSDPIAA